MVALLDLEDVDLDAYVGAELRGGEPISVNLPFAGLEAEATQIALGLAAMRDDTLLGEIPLVLAVRLRVDDVVHLWSDESSALRATVVLDPRIHTMRMNLWFAPAGRSASSAAAGAAFLNAGSTATHLALRLPDGHLAGDRLPVPTGFKVDEGLVRLFELIAEVARLAQVDVLVPEDVDEELIKDLVLARYLLSGQAVRSRWSTGEARFDISSLATLKEILEPGSRHDLNHTATMSLDVQGTQVPLGEVRQQFSDAIVEDLIVEDDAVVLRLRAHGGSAPTVMTPTVVAPEPLEPHLVLPETVFDELVADLDAPVRPNPLRKLM